MKIKNKKLNFLKYKMFLRHRNSQIYTYTHVAFKNMK